MEGNGLRASLTAKPEAPGTDIGLSRRPRADSDPIRNFSVQHYENAMYASYANYHGPGAEIRPSKGRLKGLGSTYAFTLGMGP